MTANLPARRKLPVAKPIIGKLIGMSIITWICFAMFLCSIGWLNLGHYPLAAIGFLVTAWFVSMVVPALVSGAVEIRQIRGMAKREYLGIDVAYARSIALLRALPVMKAAHLATMLCNRGTFTMYQGRFEDAEQLFRESIGLSQKNKRMEKVPAYVIIRTNLASVCARQGKFVEADLELENAFDLLKKTKSENSFWAAFPLLVRAAVRAEQNELPEASADVSQARNLLGLGTNGKYISETSVETSLVYCMQLQALIALRVGDKHTAERLYNEILTIRRANPSIVNTQSAKWFNFLADEYLKLGMVNEAEQMLGLSYQILRDFPNHPDAAGTQSRFANLLTATNRAAEIDDMKHWLLPIIDG